MRSDLTRPDRLFRNVTVSATLAALAYLAFSLWVGWRGVADAVERVGVGGLALALLLSLANYGVRSLRWQLYLRALGARIPPASSALIYLSGFAFTTTPGKVGELLRGVYLHARGMPFLRSTAAFVSERLSDLVAMILLALPGLWFLSPLAAVAAAGVLLAGALVLALLWHDRQRGVIARVIDRAPARLGTVLRHAAALIGEMKRCHGSTLVAGTTMLSIVAWGAEALAFALILQRLGIELSLGTAVFIYAASMIAGALSFLPGGLGGAEATMVGLLALSGAPNAESVAATILIRFTTLWFAVGIGIAVTAIGRRSLRAPATATPA